MDIDSLCIRPLDTLFDDLDAEGAQCFFVHESEIYYGPLYVASTVLGAQPGSYAIFLLILKWFEAISSASKSIETAYILTGPILFTETFLHHGIGWNSNCAALKSNTFFPVHFEDLNAENASLTSIISYAKCQNSFAVHLWDKRQIEF